ncbi:monovalent cation/H+ antiporter complex subunit F [Micropruina sp.]|uniref:monovalent cation/H+ antiporter complex subunit F n=1 Tax=Micropruina sp. TaxID=2737536 RepID=UPI0039E6C2A5
MSVVAVLTQVLLWAAVIMIGAAAALTLWRLTNGPSTLDRIVSADVMVSTVLAGIGVSMVVFHNTTALPILLVLSMVAFTGGVSVARLMAPKSADRQRYRRDRGGAA